MGVSLSASMMAVAQAGGHVACSRRCSALPTCLDDNEAAAAPRRPPPPPPPAAAGTASSSASSVWQPGEATGRAATLVHLCPGNHQ